jgi:hypothetical protein
VTPITHREPEIDQSLCRVSMIAEKPVESGHFIKLEGAE